MFNSRKLFAIFLALFFGLFPTVSEAAISIVQHTTVDGASTTSQTLAYVSNPSLNDLIIVCVRLASTITSAAFSDTIGNSWSNLSYQSVTGASGVCGYAINKSSAADTITANNFSGNNSSSTVRMAIYEYSGNAVSGVLDVQNNSTSGSSSGSINAATITPFGGGELIFGYCYTQNSETYTQGTNFTLEDQVPTGLGNGRLGVQDWIQPSGSGSSTNSPMSIGTTSGWGCGVAAFFPVSVSACNNQISLLGMGCK